MLTSGRQVMALITAAFVLVSHVYCACAASPASTTAAAGVDAAGARPHCHGHRSELPPQENKPGSPDHRGDPSCQHCKPALKAEDGPATNATDLKPSAWPAPLLAAWSPRDGDASAAHRRPVAGDLSPPQHRPTLLDLHCALNT